MKKSMTKLNLELYGVSKNQTNQPNSKNNTSDVGGSSAAFIAY